MCITRAGWDCPITRSAGSVGVASDDLGSFLNRLYVTCSNWNIQQYSNTVEQTTQMIVKVAPLQCKVLFYARVSHSLRGDSPETAVYTLEAIHGFVTVRSWISDEISTRSKVIVAHEKQRRWINVPCPTAPPYTLFNAGHLKTGWSRPNKNGVKTVENFFNDYKLDTTLQVVFTLLQWLSHFSHAYWLRAFVQESSVYYKPHTNRRNIVGQQLQSLLDATCCVRLHTLLHVVTCCWEFETGQTFCYVQTDAITPNNVGSLYWPTMVRPFAL